MNLSYYALVFLVTIFILFPDDFWRLVFYATLRLKTVCLNLVLMASSYWLYLRLSRELKSFGLEPPAFHFIPIEDRQS